MKGSVVDAATKMICEKVITSLVVESLRGVETIGVI